jgi:hypothetical protein
MNFYFVIWVKVWDHRSQDYDPRVTESSKSKCSTRSRRQARYLGKHVTSTEMCKRSQHKGIKFILSLSEPKSHSLILSISRCMCRTPNKAAQHQPRCSLSIIIIIITTRAKTQDWVTAKLQPYVQIQTPPPQH